MDCNLSYEEEQLQKILIDELKNQKLLEERELKIKQNKEYEYALQKDLLQDRVNDDEINSRKCEVISMEEMRRLRILRFDKK